MLLSLHLNRGYFHCWGALSHLIRNSVAIKVDLIIAIVLLLIFIIIRFLVGLLLLCHKIIRLRGSLRRDLQRRGNLWQTACLFMQCLSLVLLNEVCRSNEFNWGFGLLLVIKFKFRPFLVNFSGGGRGFIRKFVFTTSTTGIIILDWGLRSDSRAWALV